MTTYAVEDYEALRKRHLELYKPPFVAGRGNPGAHCPHCPKGDAEVCPIGCHSAYKDLYGFDPPPQEPAA